GLRAAAGHPARHAAPAPGHRRRLLAARPATGLRRGSRGGTRGHRLTLPPGYLFSAVRKRCTIGTAESAPAPPCSTMTAKATPPCQPTNQACVSCEPVLNSAVQ